MAYRATRPCGPGCTGAALTPVPRPTTSIGAPGFSGPSITVVIAAQACLLVNAIDDVADSLALTDRVREHFPGLPMIARARNVTHYVELRTRGVTVVERETFESALRTGRRVLETLGVDRFRAREMADAFRRHNVTTMEALIPHFHDEAKVLSEAKAGREELREFFARDHVRFETEQQSAWKTER